MATKSIVLQVDEKAASALALATTAEANAQQALTDAADAAAAAAAAVETQTRMYWGSSLGASAVTASALVNSITKPLIVNANGGATIGPVSFTSLLSAGYQVNSGAGWSQVFHLINFSGAPLTITLENSNAIAQSLQIDGAAGPAAEAVAIWYDASTNNWRMGPSAL